MEIIHGWMDPEGKIVPCEQTKHIEKAEEIYEIMKPYYGELKEQDSQTALMNRGWIHISKTGNLNSYEVFWNITPNTEQFAILRKWFEDPEAQIQLSARTKEEWEKILSWR